MNVIPASIVALRERAFGSHHELIRAQASLRPQKIAMIQESRAEQREEYGRRPM